MAAIRSVWRESVGPWVHYAYALASLTSLLAPRTRLWTRRWFRTRVQDRIHIARDVSASPIS